MTDHRLKRSTDSQRVCTCGSGTYWTGDGPTDDDATWFCAETKQPVGTERPFEAPARQSASSTNRRKVVEIRGVFRAHCEVAGCGWEHISLTFTDADAAASNHRCSQSDKS